jgi:type VI secretion system ImpM family protein
MPGEAVSGVFAFGKLPAHGDFVARGLDEPARAAWDAWATAGLQAAHDALGEGFEAAHERAPPWRFRFGPGRFGEAWRTGAFAPSVDRTGRRFVIVLGVDGAGDDARAEAIEDVLYRTLCDGLGVDEMVQAARELPPSEDLPQARFWTLGGPEHPPESLAAAEPGEDLLLRALRPLIEAGSP